MTVNANPDEFYRNGTCMGCGYPSSELNIFDLCRTCAEEIPARPWNTPSDPDVRDVDALAAIIRKVDGNHDLGASALAEKLLGQGVRFIPGTPRNRVAHVLDMATVEYGLGHQETGDALAKAASALADQYGVEKTEA